MIKTDTNNHMDVLRKTSLIAIIMIMALLIIRSECYAEDSGIQLSFYANHDGIFDHGHSWLDVTNHTDHDIVIGEYILEKGKTTYIGARGGERDASSAGENDLLGGAFFNFEGASSSLYTDYAKVTTNIDENQLHVIYDYMKNFGEYSTFSNNCTTFAYNVWNTLVEDEYKIPKSIFEAIADQPYQAKKYIVDKLGAQENSYLPSFGYNNKDVYLVSPSGHLQPFKHEGIGEMSSSDVFLTSNNCNSITITWKSPLRKIGVHDYNLTAFVIKYYETAAPSKSKSLIIKDINAVKETITGLKGNTEYSFQIKTVNDQNDGWFVVRSAYSDAKSITTRMCNIGLQPKTKTLYIDCDVKLTPYFTCHKDTLKADKVTWKTSAKSVATVNRGVVKGIKAGTATITAIYDNYARETCIITVLESKIIIPKSHTIYKGMNYTITPKVYGKSKKITWSSSNTKIATVNSKGKVISKKAGKVTITAKANGMKAKCKVTIKKPKIQLSKKKLILTKGDKTRLRAVIWGKQSRVKWSSNKKSIATVDKGGNVKAKKPGKAVITAKANGVVAKCKVIVKKAKPFSFPSKVALDPTSVSERVSLYSSVTTTPTLMIESVSGSKVTFRISFYNFCGNYFYSRIVTRSVTATVKNRAVKNAKWEDSHGNAGTVTLNFKSKNTVDISLTTNKFSYDPYTTCYLQKYVGTNGAFAGWDNAYNETIWKYTSVLPF